MFEGPEPLIVRRLPHIVQEAILRRHVYDSDRVDLVIGSTRLSKQPVKEGLKQCGLSNTSRSGNQRHGVPATLPELLEAPDLAGAAKELWRRHQAEAVSHDTV